MVHNELIEKLRQHHGKNLDLKNDVYYLFLKDAVVTVYVDNEEQRLKLDIEMLPEDHTFVYHDDATLEDFVRSKKE